MPRNKKCKNFKQYDSRWGRVPYPKAPYFVSDSGCGPTAVADLIVTNPKHKNKTPKNTANWLRDRGYATYGNGTAWAGITACLKAYGFNVTQHDDMSSFFKEMKKKGRMAIISFRGGTRGGVTWTLGGHFLACSGMVVKNGKHKLYMLDPGPRNNNGWHTYETQMKGLVAQLWTCHLPEKETKMKKKNMKELVAYAKKRANEHHPYGRKAPMSWRGHFDCHWMTRNIYKDCGYISIYNRIGKKGKPHFYKEPYAKNRLGPYLAVHRKKGLTPDLLRGGDIVVRPLSGGGGYHSAIYIGGGKVAETTGSAKGGRGSHIGKLTKKYTYAFRIPEPYSAKYEVLKTRAVRKSWTSKSEALRKLKPGTIFKTDKRRGNWVHVTKIRSGKEWKPVSGWVCVKGKSGKRCKKIN